MPSTAAILEAEEKTSQAVTFQQGLEFIEKNHEADHWFSRSRPSIPTNRPIPLKEDKALYPHTFLGDAAERPTGRLTRRHQRMKIQSSMSITNMRRCFPSATAISERCWISMDQYHLWDDTMLIVNTDHGFLLGEHGWWGRPACQSMKRLLTLRSISTDPRRRECAGARKTQSFRLST